MSDSASSTGIRAQRISFSVSDIIDALDNYVLQNRAPFRLDVEALLGVGSETLGPFPASRVSIEAMPRVAVTKEEVVEKDCAICLDGYEVGGEAREMPCKHMFHSGCIERWLGLHGSCPVCRFAMPVEEGNVNSGGGYPITGRGFAAADSDDSRRSDENEVDDAWTQDMQF
ncbi:hypothetical protein FH972_007568 [Carpinus fangiana]|uniref:RING-type E3 ubiquitin transferase n=1 Tax=Carpinus fangiana TaxID=176857 RepID=A0A5N6QWU9_9ROSI|nr:hypothetical protein FH972_007568 [Carpinus fangiana]